jgi:lactase-phlorizin hydrolase
LTCNFDWHEPKDKTNMGDLEASERGNQFWIGLYTHPVYVNGDYPDIVKNTIGNKSLHQNYSTSRLPKFTEHEKHYIKGI